MDGTFSGGSIVVAAKDQVYSKLAGEAVILNLKAGIYYGLDEVGTRIWELIQGPRTITEVRDAVLEEYDVDPGRCESDLVAILQNLKSEGIIEVKHETDA